MAARSAAADVIERPKHSVFFPLTKNSFSGGKIESTIIGIIR